MAYYLSSELVASFHKNGFLVIQGFLQDSDCSQLKKEAERMVDLFYDPQNHPLTIFSTERENEAHGKAKYFLESGDKVRFFFEETKNQNSKSCNNVLKSLNKIGHALHIHSERFRAVSHGDERIVGILKDLQYKQPIVLQSMVIFKQPGVGSAVTPHQDSTFLYTDPQSALGFWFPLEDCDSSNGTLTVYPGSHLTFPQVRTRFVRDGNCDSDGGAKLVGDLDAVKSEWSKFPNKETLTIRKGSLVLLHGSLVHESSPNLSKDKSRYAYTFHCIEGASSHSYPSANWLQSTDPRVFQPLFTA